MSTLNLDEMIKLAKKVVNEEVPIEEQCRAKFESIVSFLSYQFYHTNKSYIDSRDDLENEMWIKIFDMLHKVNDNLDDLNKNLVFIVCKNLCCDYYNKERYNYKEKICRFDETFINGDNEGNQSDSTKHSERSDISSTLDKIEHPKFENNEDNLIIEEIVSLFEKGSRKRRYAVTKLYYAGMIPEDSPLRKEVVELDNDSEPEYLLKIVNRNGSKNTKVSGAWIWEKKQEMLPRIRYYLRFRHKELGDYTPEAYTANLKDYLKSEYKTPYIEIDRLLKSNYEFKNRFYHDEIIDMIKDSTEVLFGQYKGIDYVILNDEKVVRDLLGKGFQIFVPEIKTH